MSWRILNADSATLTANSGPNVGPVSTIDSSVTVSTPTSTVYTLTAKNATSQDVATTTVTVQQPLPRLLTCTAVPMTINQGESSRIIYDSLNADSVTITPPVGGPIGTSGQIVVTPAATTNYVITANNAFGSATCSVAVQVVPGTGPRIIRFSAAPLNIPSGGVSTLVWQVENATQISIAPNVGSVSLVGTLDVTLTQTTTYTITASNPFGTVSAQVTINVIQPPPPPPDPLIISFVANPPQSPSPGSPVVLTCLANNAVNVVVNGVGPLNASGSVTVNPLVTTTYTCVATNSIGKQAVKTLTVPVANPGGGGGGGGPIIVITSSGGTCTLGSANTVTICETLNRLLDLNLKGSSSPDGNLPLSFFVTSRQNSAVVLNPTSSTPSVQLSELFGDYFFDVTVTDSKGNKSTAVLDVRFVSTRSR